MLALDVFGKTLWTHRQEAQLASPAMTTAGGLVFVGDTDRYMYAFDAATGKVLWKSPRMLTKLSGSPVTYTAGGRQYVAFVTGVGRAQLDFHCREGAEPLGALAPGRIGRVGVRGQAIVRESGPECSRRRSPGV